MKRHKGIKSMEYGETTTTTTTTKFNGFIVSIVSLYPLNDIDGAKIFDVGGATARCDRDLYRRV